MRNPPSSRNLSDRIEKVSDARSLEKGETISIRMGERERERDWKKDLGSKVRRLAVLEEGGREEKKNLV